MTCYGPKEIAGSFRTVRKNTITIAEEIPEQQYGFTAAPETRSIGATLVHIAVVPRIPLQIHSVERRTSMDGFDFPSWFGRILAEENVPRTKQQILDLLREEGERFASWVEGVPDEFLAERISFPAGFIPPIKTRFEMLIGVKEHEMHHRAQLMLMERMIGIVPHLTRAMQARMAAAQTSRTSAS